MRHNFPVQTLKAHQNQRGFIVVGAVLGELHLSDPGTWQAPFRTFFENQHRVTAIHTRVESQATRRYGAWLRPWELGRFTFVGASP